MHSRATGQSRLGLGGTTALLQKGMLQLSVGYDLQLTSLQATQLTPPDNDIQATYNYSYDLSAHGGPQSPAKISFPEFQYPDMCKKPRPGTCSSS
jgi:hypothetical protein